MAKLSRQTGFPVVVFFPCVYIQAGTRYACLFARLEIVAQQVGDQIPDLGHVLKMIYAMLRPKMVSERGSR